MCSQGRGSPGSSPGSFDALGFVRERKGLLRSPSVSTSVGNTNEQQALYADRQRSNEMLGWQLKLDELRVKYMCVCK